MRILLGTVVCLGVLWCGTSIWPRGGNEETWTEDSLWLNRARHEWIMSRQGAVTSCLRTDALMNALKDVKVGYEAKENERLSNEKLEAMDICSRVGYTLLFPESFFQICSFIEPDPPGLIRSEFSRGMQGTRPSARQVASITKDRDAAIACIASCLNEGGPVSDELKSLVLQIDGYELIPGLAKSFRHGQDKDLRLLTVLVVLMREGSYVPFTTSAQGTQLQPTMSVKERIGIPATTTDIEAILTMAMAYHAWRTPH